MTDASYSIADAERDLSGPLGNAPALAVSGSWTATTLQAGVSSCEGCWQNANGDPVPDPDERYDQVSTAICTARDRLETEAGLPPWNKLAVHWSKAPAAVVITPSFDAAIVPRGVDDPAYDQAAAARHRFWQCLGIVQPGFLAEDLDINHYNQTKWFGPHRRIITVRGPGTLLLATDGLSTPWAGIPDRTNGVECEILLTLTGPDRSLPTTNPRLTLWAVLLRTIGDAFADDNSLPKDIETNGPILAFRLDADYAPHTRIVLSLHEHDPVIPAQIPGLPFGPVRLLAATPVTDQDLAGLDQSDRTDSTARAALARQAARVAAG